jgi:hypothetical protein
MIIFKFGYRLVDIYKEKSIQKQGDLRVEQIPQHHNITVLDPSTQFHDLKEVDPLPARFHTLREIQSQDTISEVGTSIVSVNCMREPYSPGER